jgi:hypothetical protein
MRSTPADRGSLLADAAAVVSQSRARALSPQLQDHDPLNSAL